MISWACCSYTNTSADANYILATNGTNKWRVAMMDGDDYLQIYDDINDRLHTVFKSDGNVSQSRSVVTVNFKNLTGDVFV